MDFITKTANMLAAAKAGYSIKPLDLGEYGTSYEITKRDSTRKLHVTPLDGDLLDMVCYGRDGLSIAQMTMASPVLDNLQPNDLTSIITICFKEENHE